MNRYKITIATLLVTAACAEAAEYGPKWEFPGTGAMPLATDGAYVCIVHRAVGFQGDAKKGQRFAGTIKLTDEQAKFTLTLSERTDGLIGSRYCAEAKPVRPDYKPGQIERDTGMRYYSDLNYWFTCKANIELQLSPSKVMSALRGDNHSKFMSQAGDVTFQLWGEQGFLYTYPDFAGNNYMEEGVCQKM